MKAANWALVVNVAELVARFDCWKKVTSPAETAAGKRPNAASKPAVQLAVPLLAVRVAAAPVAWAVGTARAAPRGNAASSVPDAVPPAVDPDWALAFSMQTWTSALAVSDTWTLVSVASAGLN